MDLNAFVALAVGALSALVGWALVPFSWADAFVNLYPWPSVALAFVAGVVAGVFLLLAVILVAGVLTGWAAGWQRADTAKIVDEVVTSRGGNDGR